MFLLQLWLLNGVERVSAWCGVCLILQEHMHQVQFSLTKLILCAILGGKPLLLHPLHVVVFGTCLCFPKTIFHLILFFCGLYIPRLCLVHKVMEI
uniref:Uncharacterized protein n=1 Tax=Lotus japonicus TaxID=34305 RepID=I3SKP3_LOTJA|nr:unknown [Lotus japonicus]